MFLSMKERIGFLPITIWKPDWHIVNKLKEIIGDSAQERKDAIYRSPSNALRGGGKGKFGKTASIFNPHLAQMILSAYCPPKAKIYDPFAGGGTRGFIAAAMGHSYTGIEIRPNEVERILQQQEKLSTFFRILVGDATKPAPEKDFDFIYTCPPYFNLEVYSKLPEDISTASDYSAFLLAIKDSLRHCFGALKPNTLCIWVVGNFRDKNGKLIHFSGDIVRVAEEVGFQFWDEIIFWGASNSAVQRCGNFGANRKAVRVHENILIFKKPFIHS